MCDAVRGRLFHVAID